MAVEPGPIQYASSPGGFVAYQVVGHPRPERPVVVLLTTLTASFESFWVLPAAVSTLTRLAEHCTVVLIDRRGTGGSDPLGAEETPDRVAHAADVAAVLEAENLREVVLVGESYMAGPTVLTVAAEHPERIREVVVIGVPVRPQLGERDVDGTIQEVLWGDAHDIGHLLTPSVVHDEAYQAWSAKAGRATSPAVASRMWESMLVFDLAPLLREVVVPVTVVSTGHWTATPEAVDELASRLAQSRVVAVPRADAMLFIGDNDALIDEILLVATGARHRGRGTRRLLAMLFTDLVESTERVAEVGDTAWRELLDEHDRVARSVVADHDGELVKSLGDGLLATFALPSSAVASGRALLDRLAGLGLVARAGVHVGEVEVRGDDIGGLAVHVAARVADLAAPGEVLVTGAVQATTMGSGQAFAPSGSHDLRGVPGSWALARLISE